MSDRPALIPYPRRIEWTDDGFDLAGPIRIVIADGSSDAVMHTAEAMVSMLRESGAADMSIVHGNPSKPGERGVGLMIGTVGEESAEAYRLSVGRSSIRIVAPEAVGLFYAAQTIRQLAVDGWVAGCEVVDWPAFAWRGLMLDAARNFWSLPLIREQMEELAHYKMNVFHFHLTDYTAWRMEVRSHPELTKPEFQTRQPGKFYTQAEIRDLIEFCRQLHIMVIPEIDMPGHSIAFANATGVDMQSPEGMEILRDVLAEVVEVFDAPYIHLGADEVNITNSEFLPKMGEVVRSYGREAVLWLPGSKLDDDAIYELWSRSSAPATARCIDSRPYYINHLEPLSGIVSTFKLRVCDADDGSDLLLGGETPLWHDRHASSDVDMMRMNPLYPTLLTLAERTWRGGGEVEPDSGTKLAQPGTREFEEFAEFEDRLVAHRNRFFERRPFPYVRQSGIMWSLLGPYPNGGKMDSSFAPEQGTDLDMGQVEARGGTVWLCDYLPDPDGGRYDNSTVYALTYAHAARDMAAYMWIGFRSPSRSDCDPTPNAGEWDFNCSAIWLNDEPIPAPKWAKPGRPGHPEDPLIDEGYSYRPPTPVKIKAGWNKILVRVPRGVMREAETYGKLRTNPYPPDKWMFTAVLIDWDGHCARELEGVTYSTQVSSSTLDA